LRPPVLAIVRPPTERRPTVDRQKAQTPNLKYTKTKTENGEGK
jgi:hypothetical protein